MDAQDNTKIHNTLEIIFKKNEKNIIHQITNQYSINFKIIETYNKTAEDIKHNY